MENTNQFRYVVLSVKKDRFRFNSAHFMIYNTQNLSTAITNYIAKKEEGINLNTKYLTREKLHGHNYRVSLEIGGYIKAGEPYLVDFSLLKDIT